MFTDSDWATGVTIFGWNGFRMQAYYPPANMFATKEGAQKVADILGVKVFDAPAGSFGAYSHPLYMVNRSGNPLNAAACAGMLADTMRKYGHAPGSNGRALAERDLRLIEGAE